MIKRPGQIIQDFKEPERNDYHGESEVRIGKVTMLEVTINDRSHYVKKAL
jgi:hypothetical protein